MTLSSDSKFEGYNKPSFQGVLLSDLHTFEVGQNKVPYTVHSGAIARLSHELQMKFTGPWTEMQTKRSEWQHVDEETFVRFCEFAYTGNYTPPHYSMEKDDALDDEMAPTNAGNVSASRGNVSDSSKKPDLSKKKPEKKFGGISSSWNPCLRQFFEERKYPIHVEPYEANPNDSEFEIYSPVFLGHAKLYVLADLWNIKSLKMLALHNLHKTLVMFSPYRTRIPDIIDLIRFAYNDEHTRDDEKNPEDLRDLIVHYVACELEAITGSKYFLELLEEGGPFVRDFWKMFRNEAFDRLYDS